MRHRDARKLLNDFIDGNLEGNWRDELERHVQECVDCRREISHLKALHRQAAVLPDSVQPDRDLWPDIAAAIARKPQPIGAGKMSRAEVVPSDQKRAPAGWRRWLLPSERGWTGVWRPAVAAAAIMILVLMSVVAIRYPGRSSTRSADALVMDEPDPATVAVLAALEAECNPESRQTRTAGPEAGEEQQGRSILELIAHNLRIIDLAIADAREAWSADPRSPHLARLLASAYRAKAALQQQHTELATRI